MRIMVLAFSLAAAGCVSRVALLKSKPDEHLAVFGVALGNETAPSMGQKNQLIFMAQGQCGGDNYRVIEEGTDIANTPYFSMVGSVASAGEVQTRSYYWIVRCGDWRESQPAATDGCSKDTDCKGERICEARVCVEPHTAGSGQAP